MCVVRRPTRTERVNPFERVIRRIDRYQQTHLPLAVTFALIKKFGDDRAGSLAALIAYYAFLAVFPLLLLLTTILGFAMDRNSALQRSVLDSALRDFPIVGQQLGEAIRPLQGNAFALTVGLVFVIWGSLGFTQAGQLAMAEVWNVPGVDRPPFAHAPAPGLRPARRARRRPGGHHGHRFVLRLRWRTGSAGLPASP